MLFHVNHLQMIHMKYQALITLKMKKKKLQILLFAATLIGVLKEGPLTC